jgi:sugar O-acyltransferase (sialic acid O-acetyltransferase NeuD family)
VQPVVILGAGGFAREVLDIFELLNEERPRFEVLGFVVDTGFGEPGTDVNGRPILGDFGWLERRAREVLAICGVGAPQIRFRMVSRAEALGVRFCNAIDPSARLTRRVELADGIVIGAGCILTNRIRLGRHVHLNLDCTVGHDAVFEDFATTAPGVHVSGNVTFEEGAYAGTGANLIEGMRLGAWSVVGAGSTVIRDVPPNTTAVGSPARVVKTRAPGWHLA